MKKLFAIFFFYITTSFFYAKSSDTLRFNLSELNFHSDFEKRAFEDIEQGKEVNFLKLFLALDSSITQSSFKNYDLKIRNTIEHLKQETSKAKNLEKKCRTIFSKTHEDYLQQYVENIKFSKIFNEGKYNCLTASALYSLILDKLEISYAIKEYPTHIAVLVDPQNQQINLETTDPITGYRIFDDKYKENFISYLKEQKLIEKVDLNKPTTVLFEKYFYNETHLSFKQLAGLGYYNAAIEKIEEVNYTSAIYLLEKGYFLYPSEKIKFILNELYFQKSIEVYNNLNTKEFRYLIMRYKTQKNADENLISDYIDRLSQKLVIENDKVEEFEEITSSIEQSLNDSILREKVLERKYLALTLHYFLKNDQTNTLTNGIRAYVLNKDNLRIKRILKESLYFALFGKDIESGNDLINQLSSQIDSLDFLKKDAYLSSFRLCFRLKKAGTYFIKNDGQKGNEFLNLAEKEVLEREDIDGNIKNTIAFAYSEASSYYVRNKNYTRAKELLKFGLKYVPNDGILNQKLGYLKNY